MRPVSARPLNSRRRRVRLLRRSRFAFVLALLLPCVAAAQNDEIVVTTIGVGIGTSTPIRRLHLFGDSGNLQFLIQEASATQADRTLLTLFNLGPTRFALSNKATSNPNNNNLPYSWSFFHLNNGGFAMTLDGSGKQEFFIDTLGNLYVEGKIKAGNELANPPTIKDIVATGNVIAQGEVFSTTCSPQPTNPCAPAPDYVFDSEYPLLPLEDLESFVRENRHLPNVPSSEELVGPINMSKLQMALLEKVEELTLYAIQLGRVNQQLQKRVEALDREIDALVGGPSTKGAATPSDRTQPSPAGSRSEVRP
jgi:hypothetical protein